MAIRVVHIGTGLTGRQALREILVHPDLELAGLYVTSPEKVGRDAGELCGMPQSGIAATGNIDQLLELNADCLCYAGSTTNREEDACREIGQFLQRGTNVVTFAIVSMVYPPAGPPALRTLLKSATEIGGASFYASGSEPGFASVPVPAVLLSFAGEVTCYRMEEYILDLVKVYGHSETVRESIGMGQSADFVPERFTNGTIQRWWEPDIRYVAKLLGLELDLIRFSWESSTLSTDLDTAIGKFKAGTIGAFRWELAGIVNSIPRVVLDYNVWLSREIGIPEHWPRPAPDTKDGAFVYKIDGTPKFKAQIYFDSPADSAINTPLLMTAMHVVNAIPSVVVAEPGLLSAVDLPYYVTRSASLGHVAESDM